MENSTDEDVKPGTGLFCFTNGERECGPDCMAYLTSSPGGPDYETPDGRMHQWAHCMVLVQQHRLSKHVVLVANIIRASDQRAGQPQPQAPFLQKP